MPEWFLIEFWLPDKEELNGVEDNILLADTMAWLEHKLRLPEKLEAHHL